MTALVDWAHKWQLAISIDKMPCSQYWTTHRYSSCHCCMLPIVPQTCDLAGSCYLCKFVSHCSRTVYVILLQQRKPGKHANLILRIHLSLEIDLLVRASLVYRVVQKVIPLRFCDNFRKCTPILTICHCYNKNVPEITPATSPLFGNL